MCCWIFKYSTRRGTKLLRIEDKEGSEAEILGDSTVELSRDYDVKWNHSKWKKEKESVVNSYVAKSDE